MVSVAKVQELLTSELRAIVRDNGVWDSNSMDDVCKEQHGLFGLDLGDGADLNPLRELVDCDE